ncbi:hypothetical protein SAMN05443574_12041 [Haloarcula vallismortis]|uniref:Sulfatase N-terminal domain-containing protein n=2 Tax=Haloarcula vallismortis TaxID=28442 RepID=M0JMD0_HALVA|nr:hypothetical protein [Haloarcula vallismortis]EMA08840.1 hypothetical protein C437_07782 [Haloarcula vallismortis ATCC 29715]SDX23260.1 hypothetical protein SAMN05443574_12041 [Haloarcula vallismortis]
MANLNRLQGAVSNPGRALTELNRLYHTRGGFGYNPDGVDVFAEDWDTLVLLDACRFDEFKRQIKLSGSLEKRISRGATSAEFVRGNFGNRQLHDVVYTSANGWFAKLQEEIDAEVHQFTFVERDAVQGLTSKPQAVTDRAIQAANDFPNKRHVVHYMQPHQPYLGPTGQRLNFGSTLAETVEQNDLSQREVKDAYQENLSLALDAVERLVESIDGKIVISADHGEHLGERERPLPVSFYGHMGGLYTPELVEVPWYVLESDRRRKTVREEPSKEGSNPDIEAVEQNLRDLGYKV